MIDAIKDKIKVNNNFEVGYTPFLSLPCPWRLDGLRAGRAGLDSGQGQDVSLLHNVQTGSGPTQPPINEYRGLFLLGLNGRGVKLRYNPICKSMKFIGAGTHN
jgi:hypothetical protein